VFHAEGGVSNGTVLSKFRRGGFSALKPVLPVFLEYEYYTVSPSYDCILGAQWAILAVASCFWPT